MAAIERVCQKPPAPIEPDTSEVGAGRELYAALLCEGSFIRNAVFKRKRSCGRGSDQREALQSSLHGVEYPKIRFGTAAENLSLEEIFASKESTGATCGKIKAVGLSRSGLYISKPESEYKTFSKARNSRSKFYQSRGYKDTKGVRS